MARAKKNEPYHDEEWVYKTTNSICESKCKFLEKKDISTVQMAAICDECKMTTIVDMAIAGIKRKPVKSNDTE